MPLSWNCHQDRCKSNNVLLLIGADFLYLDDVSSNIACPNYDSVVLSFRISVLLERCFGKFRRSCSKVSVYFSYVGFTSGSTDGYFEVCKGEGEIRPQATVDLRSFERSEYEVIVMFSVMRLALDFWRLMQESRR